MRLLSEASGRFGPGVLDGNLSLADQIGFLDRLADLARLVGEHARRNPIVIDMAVDRGGPS